MPTIRGETAQSGQVDRGHAHSLKRLPGRIVAAGRCPGQAPPRRPFPLPPGTRHNRGHRRDPRAPQSGPVATGPAPRHQTPTAELGSQADPKWSRQSRACASAWSRPAAGPRTIRPRMRTCHQARVRGRHCADGTGCVPASREPGRLAYREGPADSVTALIFSRVTRMPFRLVRPRANPAIIQYRRMSGVSASSNDSVTSVPAALGSSW
jgi:hypothetical protein